jgi:CHRD domain
LTGQAASAHVHLGKAGRAGPVVLGLCGPCRSGTRGTSNVSARIANALRTGAAYVNVHTTRNPAGEIRGQLTSRRTGATTPTTTTTTTTTTQTGGDPYP